MASSRETDIYTKKVLVFGCGNTLFGNDGFGPEVVNHIHANYHLPQSILVLDAGTGIRDFIFDLLLMDNKPEKILIVDAVTFEGRSQGEVFEIDLARVPKEKMADFSLHQAPSSNLLSQLKAQGVDVRILGMHTDSIPNTVNPGLTREAQDAVAGASEWVIQEIEDYLNQKKRYKHA